MKTYKITYWSTTGLFSVMLIMSAGMYVFNNEAVQETFNVLGYPTYLIYPLVAAKLTAVAILLSQKGSINEKGKHKGFSNDQTSDLLNTGP